MSNKENLKKRTLTRHEEEDALLEKLYSKYNEEDESDEEDLPYGGKIYLARKKKGDSWPCIALQVFLVLAVAATGYYAYYYYEHMHLTILHGYAHMGFDVAQHDLGQRYLHGNYKLVY